MVLVVSLPAVTSCTKKMPNSRSLIGPSPKLPARISDVRSSRGASVRRCAAKFIAYIAMCMVPSPPDSYDEPSAVPALSAPTMSGSWPLVFISAHNWIWCQSSRGRPISSPTTWLGSSVATSCTKSTSCCSRALALISWQMARMRPSRLAMTRALKLGARGRRYAMCLGGSIARSIPRICSSRSGARFSSTTPPSLAEYRTGSRATAVRSAWVSTAQNPGSSGMSCQ